MADIDAIKVSLDNLQDLLKKIDINQTKLFDTQNMHSKEVERLNGLIEKNTSTTQLEFKAVIKENQSNLEKQCQLADAIKDIKDINIPKIEEKIEQLRNVLEDENEQLIIQINENTTFRKNIEGLVDKVDKNTEFRQNMMGFSWIRHGIPVLMFLIALSTIIYTYINN